MLLEFWCSDRAKYFEDTDFIKEQRRGYLKETFIFLFMLFDIT